MKVPPIPQLLIFSSVNTMLWYLVLALSFTQYAQGACTEGCKKSDLFYKEIGCTPIFDKPEDCCPIKYNCDYLGSTKSEAKTGCKLKGVHYKENEVIPNDITYGACRILCSCRGDLDIQCGILDCPEWLGNRPELNCQFTYELDKCCHVGEICEPYENLTRCDVDGKTYYEGERFTPSSEKCKECVCQKGFSGKFEEPFCKEISCLTEIRHAKDIAANCAAVYLSSDGCCPFEFVCPEEGDKIEKKSKASAQDGVCNYGSKTLNIGDSFERSEVLNEYETRATKCECSIPPFVTCVKRSIYDLEKAPAHIRPYLKNGDE